jgi:hypothetical protein
MAQRPCSAAAGARGGGAPGRPRGAAAMADPVRNLDNFLIMLIQKLFDMMMTYTQIDNLNVTHSKHAYLNEL